MICNKALLVGPALIALASSASALQTSTVRASVTTTGAQANNLSFEGWISADGRFVAFQSSATNLVAGDTNASPDIFVRDLQNAITERVSVATGGAQGNASAIAPSISADGRFVAFTGYSSNFVVGDANGVADIFVRDRQNGTTQCVSIATGGALGNAASGVPSLSADGRFVIFDSDASNLVASDTNAQPDVFLHDRQSGTTERISVATGGAEANNYSQEGVVSLDGRFVAFQSRATNLSGGDVNFRDDIFLRDRQFGTTTRLTIGSVGGFGSGGGLSPSMSTDGRFIAYHSDATDLVANDTNFTTDVFVHDRVFGTNERVSLGSGSVQADAGSHQAAISADGNYVAFASFATNFVVGDTNGTADIFTRDRINGTIERVSVSTSGTQSNSFSQFPTISADGRRVAFESPATTLVVGDTNNAVDVFLSDRGVPSPTIYCTAGTTSNGCNASIAASSNPSVSFANACNITVTNVEGQKLGLLFYGINNAGFTPAIWSAGSTSFLCVKPPTQRMPIQSSGGTAGLCDGAFAVDWNGFQSAHPNALGTPWLVGDQAYVQTWFRDPPAPKSTNLSNAVALTYLP